MAECEGVVDIYNCVKALCSRRVNMIQTEVGDAALFPSPLQDLGPSWRNSELVECVRGVSLGLRCLNLARQPLSVFPESAPLCSFG